MYLSWALLPYNHHIIHSVPIRYSYSQWGRLLEVHAREVTLPPPGDDDVQRGAGGGAEVSLSLPLPPTRLTCALQSSRFTLLLPANSFWQPRNISALPGGVAALWPLPPRSNLPAAVDTCGRVTVPPFTFSCCRLDPVRPDWVPARN